MRQPRYARPPGGPPQFTEARSKRQKVRAAGLDPDYWYPVEYERAVPPGATLDVTFWNSFDRRLPGKGRAVARA